ncbi:type III-A CRISPR-associated RAMP protein Csm4, partial [Desulfobacter sp.]|uniref:type III-A CRISPR-associated RAMP protein Csm4 n=1 Tax=Desulfobacter sp. TaxID=2294 RepID=UPI003D0BC378
FDDNPEELCTQTPFSISSCFPFMNDVRFFPLPIGAFDVVIEDAAKQKAVQGVPSVKEWRKVKYIAEPLFRKTLKKKQLLPTDVCLDQVFPMALHGERNIKATAFQQHEQRPRIMTDQLNGGVSESAFFYCTDQFFSNTAGLFFLARFDSDDVRKKFEASLRLLEDCGIGADRSIGKGGFSFSSVATEFPVPDAAGAWLTLSLYHPTRQEVQKGVLTSGRYSLIRRSGPGGGFHVSRFRRADCWMLEEGAVIPFEAKGDAPCVLKSSDFIPHNIYRNGGAFCIPLQEGLHND